MKEGINLSVDKIRNQFAYKVWGRYALFSDPITRMGGEKLSYPIPTYQALKGITESLYWKPGYVEPCDFDEEKKRSYYADRGEVDFGVMFHGFDYPDETGRDMLAVRFWRAKMVNGVIKFCAPQDCTMRKDVREMKAKAFGGKYGNFTGLDEASLQEEGGDTAHGLDTETL